MLPQMMLPLVLTTTMSIAHSSIRVIAFRVRIIPVIYNQRHLASCESVRIHVSLFNIKQCMLFPE